MKQLIGPFRQVLSLENMALKGPLKDSDLSITPEAGVLVMDGWILETGDFKKLRIKHPEAEVEEITDDLVLLPGFIDCHTHICFAGSRSKDYALRNAGSSYQEIAEAGGGIWDSVQQTRSATEQELIDLLVGRAKRHLQAGVTTIEVKSGYGLNVETELKQLRAIRQAGLYAESPDLVSTCLAAHVLPRDFQGSSSDYLDWILNELLPVVKKEKLAARADIFIEQGAFKPEEALQYLLKAKDMGFELSVHADQFSTAGSRIAVQSGACSADHLEASGDVEIEQLAASDTVAVALPGASLGLGMNFTPARKLLDAGACLAIASDWNPGSAPMGDLLMQAAVLGAYEKLTAAEIFAALTYRAAKALNIKNKGVISSGYIADLQAYPGKDYREILYQQGKLKPAAVWKSGKRTS